RMPPQQRQLFYRQVELALAGVAQLQVVASDADDLPGLESEEAADAVVGVDEVVADGELRRVVDALAGQFRELAPALVAVQQLLAEDHLFAVRIAVAALYVLRQQQRHLT